MLAHQDGRRPTVVTTSPAMRELYRLVDRVAPSHLPVLVHGESGTGKELVARALHHRSGRRGQLIPVNCAALMATLAESELFGHARGAFTGADHNHRGVFEQADGGTLFLDEVGELPVGLQAKLLRVLEDGVVRPVGSTQSVVVDARVVAATNRDLVAMVESSSFREDLYHRLAAVVLVVQPLRDRPEDVPALVEVFLREAARDHARPQLAPGTMEWLVQQPWRGNARELRQAVHRAVLLGGPVLVPGDFVGVPLRSSSPTSSSYDRKTWRELEREVLVEAIQRHGTIAAAAAALGRPKSTVHDRLRALGIVTSRRRPSTAPWNSTPRSRGRGLPRPPEVDLASTTFETFVTVEEASTTGPAASPSTAP